MGLFLCDPILRQQVNYGLRFDLQLAGQLVDTDLICVTHTSLRLCLFRLLLMLLRFG
jgi:hypothetical protein